MLLFAALAATAQETSATIAATGPEERDVRVRQAVTFVVSVANRTAESRVLSLEAALPQGWRLLAGQGVFTLEPGADDFRLVTVFVPAAARAAPYEVRFLLRDTQATAQPQEIRYTLRVLPEIALVLTLYEGPSFVIAGRSYRLDFVARNAGNTQIRYDLRIESGYGLPALLDQGTQATGRLLEPGAQETLTVTVETNSLIHDALRHRVELVGTVTDWEGRQEGAAARGEVRGVWTAETEIIPLAVGGVGLRHTLPMSSETEASVGYAQGAQASIMETVDIHGSLDEDERHLVDVTLRKELATGEDPLASGQDRYSLRYRIGPLDVQLGDNTYAVSPLLLDDQLARGAQVSVTTRWIGLDSLVFKDVVGGSGYQGLGGGANLTLPIGVAEDAWIYRGSLGVLTPLDGTVNLGLWQRFQPFDALHVDLDAAVNLGSSLGLQPAFQGEITGKIAWLEYDLRALRAWPGFRGAARDTQSLGLTLGLQLLRSRLRVEGGYAIAERNLLLDPEVSSSDRSGHAAVGLKVRVPEWGTEVGLNWDNYLRRDRLDLTRYGTMDNTIRLVARQDVGILRFSLLSSLTHSLDRDADDFTLVNKHSLGLLIRPDDRVEYGLSLEYDGFIDRAGVATHTPGLRLSLRRTWQGTLLELKASNDYTITRGLLASMSADIGWKLARRFSWGHDLTIQGDLALGREQGVWRPSFVVSATYGVPLQVPLARMRDSAIVRGTVTHAATGEPLEGVIVRLGGLATVTGADGKYVLYLPRSGTSYLSVDRGSLDPRLIPTTKMPAEIVTPPGSTITFDVQLVEGGAVRGAVAVYGQQGQGSAFQTQAPAEDQRSAEPVRQGGLSGVFVSLYRVDEELRRAVSGADGSFAFEDLVPGSYEIRVAGGGIPPYHRVEQEQYEVLVLAGGTAQVEVRVIQEQRRIQMQKTVDTLIQDQPLEPPGDTGPEENGTSSGDVGTPPADAEAHDTLPAAPPPESSPTEPAQEIVPAQP